MAIPPSEPGEVHALPSGLRAVVQPGGGGRSAAVGVWLGAGSRHESDVQHGIAHLAEHAVFRGTRRFRTSFAVSNAIEALGGELNGETDREYTGYYARVPAEHWAAALDVLGDLVCAPLLLSVDVRREKRVALEEAATYRDTPSERVVDLVQELLWPDHPLGRTGLGTEETLASVGVAELKGFVERAYARPNTVVSVTGPVSAADFVRAVEQRFPVPVRPTEVPFAEPAREQQQEPRLRAEPRQSEETHLCFGVRAFGRSDPDRYPLKLLQVLLGEGMSSRLFQEVRDRRALAYDVDAELVSFAETGALLVYVGADRRRAGEAAARVVEQFERLRGEPPSARELADVKARCIGGLVLHLEDAAALGQWVGTSVLLEGEAPTLDELAAKIGAVEVDDLVRVANRCLRPERMNLAVVGRPLSRDPFPGWAPG